MTEQGRIRQIALEGRLPSPSIPSHVVSYRLLSFPSP